VQCALHFFIKPGIPQGPFPIFKDYFRPGQKRDKNSKLWCSRDKFEGGVPVTRVLSESVCGNAVQQDASPGGCMELWIPFKITVSPGVVVSCENAWQCEDWMKSAETCQRNNWK
jgi:hypothetical protein